MDIPRRPVYSTILKTIGYDPRRQMLDIEIFKTGQIWRYYGVSAELHQQLMAASSIGSFFEKNIKAKYKGERLK